MVWLAVYIPLVLHPDWEPWRECFWKETIAFFVWNKRLECDLRKCASDLLRAGNSALAASVEVPSAFESENLRVAVCGVAISKGFPSLFME